MDIRQKRMATTTEFSFDERSLHYVVEDNSGRIEFEIDYAEIPFKRRQVFQRNNWLRNVGLIWCVIGAFELGLALAGGGALSGKGFWILIGIGCLAVYRATWTAYTVFDTREGSIWVIRNAQHDEIVGLIESRRRERILTAFGRLDLDNDPEREVQKIEWLVREKVLARDEADRQILEVRAARSLPPPEETRKLH